MRCEDVEDVWIETNIQQEKVIIGFIYWHPNTDIKQFTQKLERVMNKIQKETGKAYVCGDINIDGIKLNANQKTMDYYNTVLTENVFQP